MRPMTLPEALARRPRQPPIQTAGKFATLWQHTLVRLPSGHRWLGSSTQNKGAVAGRAPYLGGNCQRYDGGVFASFPARVGKAIAGNAYLNYGYEYKKSQLRQPTALPELEGFIQTWMYFGLIAELFRLGYQGVHHNPSDMENPHRVDQVYEALLVSNKEMVLGGSDNDSDGNCFDVQLDMSDLDQLTEAALGIHMQKEQPHQPDEYPLVHRQPDCSCDRMTIDSQDLDAILSKPDKIPLLRVQGATKDDLTVEVVESDSDTPYIAISHVWADGLGNPTANALSRCMILDIYNVLTTVSGAESTGSNATPLIWIDTLCCPAAKGLGKDKALEKIRQVYQNAQHVVVLDAGLANHGITEALGLNDRVIRIFTSSWMRRLWTLQEAVLAKSLYFQFADGLFSWDKLRLDIVQSMEGVSMQQTTFAREVYEEFWRMDSFLKRDYYNREYSKDSEIIALNQCIRFRNVSVAEDESMCIAGLLSLDVGRLLAVEPDRRMQQVWEMLAEKNGGIPVGFLFSTRPRMTFPGWRWAPQTFLSLNESIFNPATESPTFTDYHNGNVGMPTPRGLKVNLAGFALRTGSYHDGRPQNPWPGWDPIKESYLHFLDPQTKNWYMIGDMDYALEPQKGKSKEEEAEYYMRDPFPLYSLAASGQCVVVQSTTEEQAKGIMALRVSDTNSTTDKSRDVRRQETGQVKEHHESGIAVRLKRDVAIFELDAESAYFFDKIPGMAMALREDEMTDKHLATYRVLEDRCKSAAARGEHHVSIEAEMKTDEEFCESKERLTERIKSEAAQLLEQDARFSRAAEKYMGKEKVHLFWPFVRHYFQHIGLL